MNKAIEYLQSPLFSNFESTERQLPPAILPTNAARYEGPLDLH